MPPRTKFTRDMIVDAGFEVIRESGVENFNAQAISQKLGCSTQPVMYQFKKIEDIKKAVYQKADEYHTAYITNIDGTSPLPEIGLAYIRFAATEKNLFRFLFQSNVFDGKSITDLIDAEELTPVLMIMSKKTGLSMEQTKIVFRSVFLFAHGYASMFANNTLEYDEKVISADLIRILLGTMEHLRRE